MQIRPTAIFYDEQQVKAPQFIVETIVVLFLKISPLSDLPAKGLEQSLPFHSNGNRHLKFHFPS
jgi:hypothetical protein